MIVSSTFLTKVFNLQKNKSHFFENHLSVLCKTIGCLYLKTFPSGKVFCLIGRSCNRPPA